MSAFFPTRERGSTSGCRRSPGGSWSGFDPLRVILFSSLARGEAGRDSDVDLLVMMPDGIEDERQVTVEILRA